MFVGFCVLNPSPPGGSAWPFFVSYAFFGAIGLMSLVVSVFNIEFSEQGDQTLMYKRAVAETWQARSSFLLSNFVAALC